MQKIAIYDLDRTILKTPTFTAFLIFAGGQLGRARGWRMPLWIAALVGYKMRLYGRKSMKQFGMKLFIGREISFEIAEILAQKFAGRLVPLGIFPGAARAIAADRSGECHLVIATAAQELYVNALAAALKFDAVVATRNVQSGQLYRYLLDGENCYGTEKLVRVRQWLTDQNITREDCYIRFYSDHPSDAPLLDWADEGILVTAASKYRAMAATRGWSAQDWS